MDCFGHVTGTSETSELKIRTGDLGLVSPKAPAMLCLAFRVQRQGAEVRMFLRFYRPVSKTY